MLRQIAQFLGGPKTLDQKGFRAFLQSDFLQIADVGATGGPELRWKSIRSLCHFYTFDPDPRAIVGEGEGKSSTTNFPVGVWSKRCEKGLHLTLFPSASSLFSFNSTTINPFLNASSHKIVAEETIQLDALDNLLQSVNFIKIDAEGAELEILKGASRLLNATLGLQLEVSFCERHKEAPFFSEIDDFLRKQDFQLVLMSRAHWIRKNNRFCLFSAPQLIWGNAVYLLSPQVFIERLKQLEGKEVLAAKYLLILVTYRLFDYAEDVCSQLNGLLEKKTVEKLQKCVRKSMPSNLRYTIQLILALFAGLGGLFLLFPFKKQRRKVSYFLKERLRQLSALLSNLSRDGEPDNYTVYDFEG